MACGSSLQRVLALRTTSRTASLSPASTPYWLGVWQPSLAVTFHFLSPSSKLTHKSPRVTVSVPCRTALVVDISGLLYERSWETLCSAVSLALLGLVLHSI